jgi:hypothetical protein
MVGVSVGIAGCVAPVDLDCGEEGALAGCQVPTQTAEYYAEQSSAYFDTMDYSVDHGEWPPYSEFVARWEWPPWLKLTAFGYDNIVVTDTLLTWYPSVVTDRDCRGFDTHPFGRCTVTFYYDAHEGLGCPIYEEFTFNEEGEITFIEAWSDVPGLRPVTDDDPWGEESEIGRLSSRVPGLGQPDGRIDLEGQVMQDAMALDPDVADFVNRANNWYPTWAEELEAAGDDMWAVGCGW